jgi:hypothetical protein
MALLFGGLLGLILLIVILFYVLKLFSIAMFNIPGSDSVFQVVIIMVPYVIYFSGYYYMHTKIAAAKTKVSRILARCFLVVGSLICFTTMIFSLLIFLKVKSEWLRTFESNSHYSMIIQIIVLFATAAIIATGDPKEKNWMERE